MQMTGQVFGQSIQNIYEGLCINKDGCLAPMPLADTQVHVDIRSGLARIRTTRVFRNAEAGPIEAILTMPIGFDSVVTGLRAEIDGRRLSAIAAPKTTARERYEEALDAGKMAILHEEVLRGLHMLSVGQLAPEKTVSVEIETMCTMSVGASGPFLRIPMTVGQIYGTSPLAPTDDLTTSTAVVHQATLSVTTDHGRVVLGDGKCLGPEDKVSILLDRAIEIDVEGGVFDVVTGLSADGRGVKVRMTPLETSKAPLDIAILVDNSGSTSMRVGGDDTSILEAARHGLSAALQEGGDRDKVDIWQFGSKCRQVGGGNLASARRAVLKKISGPNGGTELGQAINQVAVSGVKDILIVTDGQTWAHDVDAASREGVRLFAIVIGSGGLDANIGRLCAQTGGQLFFAKGADVETPAMAAINAMRLAGSAIQGTCESNRPQKATTIRSGVEIAVEWSGEAESTDAVGRFAAELVMPLLSSEAAEDWARAHSLCTHRTSLILVDDAGRVTNGLSQTRKVPLMASAASEPSPQVLESLRAADQSVRSSRIARMRTPSWSDNSMSDKKVFARREVKLSLIERITALIEAISGSTVQVLARLRALVRGTPSRVAKRPGATGSQDARPPLSQSVNVRLASAIKIEGYAQEILEKRWDDLPQVAYVAILNAAKSEQAIEAIKMFQCDPAVAGAIALAEAQNPRFAERLKRKLQL